MRFASAKGSALVGTTFSLADFDVGETLLSRLAARGVATLVAGALLHTRVARIGGISTGFFVAKIRLLAGTVAGLAPFVSAALVTATFFGFSSSCGFFCHHFHNFGFQRTFARLSAFGMGALGLAHFEVSEASSASFTTDSVVTFVASMVLHVGKADIRAVFVRLGSFTVRFAGVVPLFAAKFSTASVTFGSRDTGVFLVCAFGSCSFFCQFSRVATACATAGL